MLRLLSPLIKAMFKQELQESAQQVRRSAITYTIIGLFLMISLAFLLLASFLYLATHVSSLAAALILAASAFIIALIAWLIINSINARAERKRRERLEADKSALVTATSLAAIEASLKRPILAAALPLAAIMLTSLLNNKESNHQAKKTK